MTAIRTMRSAPVIAFIGTILAIGLPTATSVFPGVAPIAGPLSLLVASPNFANIAVACLLSAVLLPGMLWVFYRPSVLAGIFCVVSIVLWIAFGNFFVMIYSA